MKKVMLLLTVLLPICTQAYQRVSVHDPSIVWEPSSKTYYVFGSHRAAAKSTNLMDWTAFVAPWATANSTNAASKDAFRTQQVKKVTIGGSEHAFNNFDAYAWSAAGNSSYVIDDGTGTGNMWAPDVIYNEKMQKWCMYLSINGVGANCSIILLTADNIEGPYTYQAPIVMSGFYMSALDFHNSDMELALGTLTALPDRYKTGDLTGWRRRWPNCIDPCVFYDEQGKLWMSYGSWHGGIWMLELDENTGLRDYNVSYPYTVSATDANHVTSDPYYGTKIAGGFQVSGEGNYIKHIGNYYYLFLTYGALKANEGYQMRVFRSENPDGPYTDSYHTGAVAIYDAARVNYGPDGTRKTDRGENIFGAYGDWGFMAVGNASERSQGHNSVLVKDGRSFMVYHTRFQNRGDEHELRVHQLFLNTDGWPCAAPFEYSGETVTDAELASTQQFSDSQLQGSYKLLVHTFDMDHENKQLAKPVGIKLNSDGSITGGKTGTWSTQSGTAYITLKIDDTEYKGVVVEQTLEPSTDKVIAFTAYAKAKGYTVWGYACSKVGASDNSTAYMGDFSEPLQLTDGQTATYEFTNYSSKAENYHNWVACVSSGTTFDASNPLIVLRADNWENMQWGNMGISSNYNWDTFKNDMDGSMVVLTFRYQNGSITIRADITTANNVLYYEEFTKAGITGTVTVCMSVEKAHLVVTKAEVTSASGIRNIPVDNQPADGSVYNLAGQKVDGSYKGIVVRSGKKVWQQ